MKPIGPAAPPGLAAPTEHLPVIEQAVLKGHDGPVLSVRFNRQGTYCLSCGKDRTIRLWNPHRGIAIKTYTGHGYDVRDVAVVSDNSKFASCGGDRQIFLWDVSTGRVIRKFKGHDATVNGLCFSPNCDVLGSAGYDQCLKLWDCRSRSIDPIQVVRGFRDSVSSVAITDRADVVAGSVDGSVRRFDVRMGRVFVDEVHHPVTCVVVSGDGNCLLAACMDGCLRLLDRQGGSLLQEYKEDGRVFYWEVLEGDVVDSFQAHSDVVCSMAMHPAGDCLLTASVDGTVKVWV